MREPGGGGFLDIYGPLRVRAEEDGSARCRFMLDARHCNIHGTAHGGFLLAIVDQAMFLGPTMLGLPALGGVTMDVSAHFVRPAKVDEALDAVIEVVRETKRQIFCRGTLEQAGEVLLYFSGLLAKAR